MTKYIIFDSGPLINFSMNGLLHLLKDLKKVFPGKFLITEAVKNEVIDYPLKIKRFELGALKLEQLLKEGVIELPSLSRQQQAELESKTHEIMDIANSMFASKNSAIHLIDRGEASIFALSSIIKEPNVIAIDERTMRMISESPENLRKLMQKKLHTKIIPNIKKYAFFKNFKIIRSTELVYMAHKKKIIEIKDPRALEAMLYGMKFKGCSVSFEEINEIKALSR